jgi:Spy/CpxP family protein refolding chaperone
MKLNSKLFAAAALSLAVSSFAMAPVANAAMKKMDKMMMHKCKAGDKKCEMKMMKMKHK